MPRGHKRPWPTAVGVESAQPPPDDIQDPADKKRVVDIKPAAPVEAEYLVGLTGRVTVSSLVTPRVIKMEREYYVRE